MAPTGGSSSSSNGNDKEVVDSIPEDGNKLAKLDDSKIGVLTPLFFFVLMTPIGGKSSTKRSSTSGVTGDVGTGDFASTGVAAGVVTEVAASLVSLECVVVFLEVC